MIISYQRKKFAITEFDDDGNEYGHILKIPEFYADFPFLPMLNFDEVDSINYDDERPFYLITYHERLNKPAVSGKTPDVHEFFVAIEKNMEAIRTKFHEYLTTQDTNEDNSLNIQQAFDEYKQTMEAKYQKLLDEFTKLKSEVDKVKEDVKKNSKA